jgi:hypothetical protein
MPDLGEVSEFLERLRRSKRGNLWRCLDPGRTMTIFAAKYGGSL